jgi:glycosyltransferase involved in cell wall biosynthesis
MSRLDYRVLALLKYGRAAASTRQRLLQYEPLLKHADFDLELQVLLDDAYVKGLTTGKGSSTASILRQYVKRLYRLLTTSDFDIVWVHYEVFPYLPGAFDLLSKLWGKPIIYDFDDATFHTYDQHRSKLVRSLLGKRLAPLLRSADLALCGNRYLQSYAERYCANSQILPTVVDTGVYKPGTIVGTSGRPVVGWIGSPSTWAYVEPLLPDILDVTRRHGVDFKVVGAGKAAKPAEGMTLVDWSEDAEVSSIQCMDIGIMPLPDEPWARGKCGYKLIQYGACGLPVIASPVGVNTEIIEDGRTGLLATTPHEWREALERLILDAKLRQSMGQAGRQRIVNHYSLEVHGPRLIEFLTDIMKRTCAA